MSPETATIMSEHQIDDLIQTLRRANAHHSQLAAAFRAVSHPEAAHKARKHAQALCLSISVQAASTLAHKYISAVPLPVLELASSPSPDADRAIQVTDATTALAPILCYPSQIGTDLAKGITRPLLRCTVQEDVVLSVPILVSKWSASTTGSGGTEEGDDVEDTTERDVPQPAQIGVRYPRADDNESMDILVSPDDDDDHLPPVVQLPSQNKKKHTSRPPLPSRIPRQAAPVRLQQEQISWPQAGDAGLVDFSSSSGSSQSSLEVVTPITPEELPVSMTRRIKRKSLDDVDMDSEDYDHYAVVEKRPKYERQVTHERRGHQRTASWSRRHL